MTIDMNRGTGRTTRMLQEVLDDPALNITVVVLNHPQIRYMFNLMKLLGFKGQVEIDRNLFVRDDGRTVRFITHRYFKQHRRYFKGVTYHDHAVGELT